MCDPKNTQKKKLNTHIRIPAEKLNIKKRKKEKPWTFRAGRKTEFKLIKEKPLL